MTDAERKLPEQSAVVERTCRILHELARYGRGGARLIDLTSATGLTRPAALRILRTLCAEGLVQQGESRRYFLGPAIYRMGLVAANPLGDLEPFRAIVRKLADEAGDTAYLSLRQGDYACYLLREEGAFPVRTHLVRVGDNRLLTETYGGLTMLSSMQRSEADDILNRLLPPKDAETRRRRATVERMLAKAEKDGYVSGADLVIKGVAGLGISIPAPNGPAFLALTLSAITSRLEDDRLDEMRPLVEQAATAITKILDKTAESSRVGQFHRPQKKCAAGIVASPPSTRG